jgi:hypothetical protein
MGKRMHNYSAAEAMEAEAGQDCPRAKGLEKHVPKGLLKFFFITWPNDFDWFLSCSDTKCTFFPDAS